MGSLRFRLFFKICTNLFRLGDVSFLYSFPAFFELQKGLNYCLSVQVFLIYCSISSMRCDFWLLLYFFISFIFFIFLPFY